jgi:hypothetical protein
MNSAVGTKGANAAIQQLQAFHKGYFAVGGKRRQVLPLCHIPLADLRNQNWADNIPESMLFRQLGVKVHVSRDITTSGDVAMAGAVVVTHSHVIRYVFCEME